MVENASRRGRFFMVALVLILIVALWAQRRSEEANLEAASERAQDHAVRIDEPDRQWVVEVAGQVKAPGVYRVSPGADVAALLLAEHLLPDGVAIESASLQRRLFHGARLVVGETGTPIEIGEMSASSRLLFDIPLDVNRVTSEELVVIDGIGPKTAEAIITLREARGGFQSIEELEEVRGIGPARMLGLREVLVVGASRGSGEGSEVGEH